MIDVPTSLLPTLTTFPAGAEVEQLWRECHDRLSKRLTLPTEAARAFHMTTVTGALGQLAQAVREADPDPEHRKLAAWLRNVDAARKAL